MTQSSFLNDAGLHSGRRAEREERDRGKAHFRTRAVRRTRREEGEGVRAEGCERATAQAGAGDRVNEQDTRRTERKRRRGGPVGWPSQLA